MKCGRCGGWDRWGTTAWRNWREKHVSRRIEVKDRWRAHAIGSDGGKNSPCGGTPEQGSVRRGIDGGQCGQRQGAEWGARTPCDVNAGGGRNGIAIAVRDGGGLPAGLGRP